MTRNSNRSIPWGAALVVGSLVLIGGLAATYVFPIEPENHSAAGTSALSTSATAAGPTSADEGSASVGPRAKGLLDEFANAFESAATRVDPSVVPILSEQKVETRGVSGPDDLLRRFFFDLPSTPRFEQKLQSLGSGVIVSSDGYILTNNHVVENADRLTVITEGDERHDARVVGTDPESDLAVVKIDARGLTPATFGDSSRLRVGQWVIAVGNPLRMLHSVTAGIISATGRSSVGIADYEDFIQTDASINPGNSGGALADLDGNVIGINTAIASPSGGNVGVGFAIPINMARQVMDQLMDHGSMSRGYLGVVIQDLNEDLSAAMGLKQAHGALVGDVTGGGPADHAGIRRGDVIVRLDGRDVTDSAGLRNSVASLEPGTPVAVEVIRDGHARTLTARLGERPSTGETAAENDGAQPTKTRLGVSLQDLTPELAAHLGYTGLQGALVAATEPGSPADRAGLRRGDLIIEAGKTEVRSPDDVRRVVAQSKAGEPLLLVVRRGENTFYVAVPL